MEPDGTVCVVWVIGKRCDDEVYYLAMARLQTVVKDELTKDLTGLLNQVFDKTEV